MNELILKSEILMVVIATGMGLWSVYDVITSDSKGWRAVSLCFVIANALFIYETFQG